MGEPLDQKPLDIMYRGFGVWEESVSTAGVAKWREPRARVNAWHICQVGTARVTGGVYSCIEGSTHSFPIASRDFAKEEHVEEEHEWYQKKFFSFCRKSSFLSVAEKRGTFLSHATEKKRQTNA
jgi:hypothetical protein